MYLNCLKFNIYLGWAINELVVNWHITEKCNYSCDFCYAKYESDICSRKEYHNDLYKTYELLSATYDYFVNKFSLPVRLNFAGGEPFLSKNLKEIIKIAYNIGFKVSFISNGSILNKESANIISKYLSIAAFSIDSSCYDTNLNIGRSTRGGKVIEALELLEVIKVFRDAQIDIKINTVVSRYNLNSNMSSLIHKISPSKWKILKVLPIINNNSAISEEEFKSFINAHKEHESIIFAENNEQMTESYIMIDPLGRFYQNTSSSQSGYIYSKPILSCGVESAFNEIKFNMAKFSKRYEDKIAVQSFL